jgi:hypothetical protein
MIQALEANGGDDPFDERVLPKPHVGQAPGEALAADGIPTAE